MKSTRYSPFTCSALALCCLIIVLLIPSGNLEAKRRKKKKSPKPVVITLTPEKLASLDAKRTTFIYDAHNRPDPFRPFINFSSIERSIPTDTSVPLTPLEKYALNQFKLVGIILAGPEHSYALVEDPEHIGYTVRRGDKIGNLSGQVKTINADEVIIEEPYLDIYDKQQMRTISLTLRIMEKDNNPLLVNSD